jgi:hypothetical protein
MVPAAAEAATKKANDGEMREIGPNWRRRRGSGQIWQILLILLMAAGEMAKKGENNEGRKN